ncbi:MAG TPA: hypothetical protein VKS79_03520, partial [Gemmataceae bacterium]|nr:hypothetical protein [Gemmataceae bacterium]
MNVTDSHVNCRTGIAISLLLCATCSQGTTAAEPPPRTEEKKIEDLIATMVDAKAGWEARCKAEDDLAKLPPEKVLPRLLKLAAQPMPKGGIYNSAGRDHDKNAPVSWQIYYAVGRSWAAQVERLPVEKGGEVLLRLLGSATNKAEKTLLLRELGSHWSAKAEEALANVLRDANAPAEMQLAAAWALTRHGKQNYQDDVLSAASRAKHDDKVRLFEVLASRA